MSHPRHAAAAGEPLTPSASVPSAALVSGTRFPALDGLRIVGAVAVVTTHVGFESGEAISGPFNGLLSRLDAGVALFFVVSGFLLFGPHVRAHLQALPGPATAAYLKHRALRILPPLWIAVAAVWAFIPLSPGVSGWTYLRHATLTQIYGSDGSTWGLTQMWSLATEAAFYLALPVLAWLLTRGGRDRRWLPRTTSVLLGLQVIAMVWLGIAHTGGNERAALWLPAYLGWFGVGMALAAWHWSRRLGGAPTGTLDAIAATPGAVYALAAGWFVLLSTPIAGPYTLEPPSVGAALVKNLGYAVLGGLLVLPAVAPLANGSRIVAALSSGPAKVLGDISYGVFCYHLVVLGLVERAIHHEVLHGNFWPLELLTLAITLPVAWLSYRFVERPIMRWGRRSESASPTASAAITTDAIPASTPH